MKKFIATLAALFTLMACVNPVVFAADSDSGKVYNIKECGVEHAVDLRRYAPEVQINLVLSTSNNFVGHPLYGAAVPLLEEQTADMLKEAAAIFAEDGYAIRIYDAYRPISAQKEMWAVIHDAAYIADPGKWGSWHQRGRAIDMTLVDLETGEELEMPTPMHTFSTVAGRWKGARDQWSDDVKANVDYMTHVMTSVGFGTIQTEWWHFENTARGNCLPVDLDLAAVYG